MAKFKAGTKYNVVSMRVSNEEKAVMEELKRDTRKSVSNLMREAMQYYASYIGGTPNRTT
jgi:hypothetical protein